MKRLVIIESPFAGDVPKNIEYARRCVRDSVLRGESPIASHLLFTQEGILSDDRPGERTLGMEAGWAWMNAADAVVFYMDNGLSAGMTRGMERAISLKKEIVYRAFGYRPIAEDITTAEAAKFAYAKGEGLPRDQPQTSDSAAPSHAGK